MAPPLYEGEWPRIRGQYNLPVDISRHEFVTNLPRHHVPQLFLPPSFHHTAFERAWDRAESLDVDQEYLAKRGRDKFLDSVSSGPSLSTPNSQYGP
jgi:hypothetical protein